MTNSNNNLAPTVIYLNALTDKSRILSELKGKAGVYQWTHKESGKIYIGSAVDLSKRLKDYYSNYYLNRSKTMYICNAILDHGHSKFELTIIEIINISNLSLEETRKLILEREQHYLDSLKPKYNILSTAGSSLGSVYSEETIAKMSEAKKGESNPMFGRTGENHPFYGKIHSDETIAKLREANLDKPKTEETKLKMSISKGGGTIFVYDSDSTLVNTFCSTREAAKFFNCSHTLIANYIKNGKLFQGKWILSTTI
jgi:group I intron endonuclease